MRFQKRFFSRNLQPKLCSSALNLAESSRKIHRKQQYAPADLPHNARPNIQA